MRIAATGDLPRSSSTRVVAQSILLISQQWNCPPLIFFHAFFHAFSHASGLHSVPWQQEPHLSSSWLLAWLRDAAQPLEFWEGQILLPPPPRPADAVTRGLLSCSAFSAAHNGDPASSYTQAIQGLQLFLLLLPFPALLCAPEAGDQHCTHPPRGQSPGDLLRTTVGVFNNILLVQTLNSYLTFLTLPECSDDISLFSRTQG